MHVRAEGVPDVNDAATRSVDRDDVPLVGRCVADVAAGPEQDEATREVERGPELLPLRQERHPHGPAASLGSARDRELVHPSVRRRSVDELAVRIGDGGRVRDPVRACQGGVTARREAPEDRAARRVDRDGAPVRRRHEESVVTSSVNLDAAEVDGRRVDGPIERHALAAQPAHVCGRDPGVAWTRVVAGGVVSEASPVAADLGAVMADRGGRTSGEHEGESQRDKNAAAHFHDDRLRRARPTSARARTPPHRGSTSSSPRPARRSE